MRFGVPQDLAAFLTVTLTGVFVSLHIAVIAHIRFPIREPFMGGMEAHTRSLVDGLRARGHTVDLFASAESEDQALRPVCDQAYEVVLPWEEWRGTERLADYQRAAFATARNRIAGGTYDVVHNNSLFPELLGWLADDAMPCVTSQHVPPFAAMAASVRGVRHHDHARVTVTSQAQARTWAGADCDHVHPAANGIDCGAWAPSDERSGRFVWSGRITPNKGTALAVAAARRAGASLDLYGPIEDRTYFEREVAPLLDGDRVWRGHASRTELRRAVAAARGVLVTPMWDEPFGLVAAEALACGTPVLAFDRGALAEVVGPCGIVVPPGDADALAAAIAQADTIDRAGCRARAEAVYSLNAMIGRYEEHYYAAIAGRPMREPGYAARPASRSSCASTVALLA